LQSQPGHHSLTLPLVSPEEENICLPLVINVVSKYWGEELSLREAEQIAKKYTGVKGSVMIEGIELAEKHGLKGYVYRGSIVDIKRKIDQGIPIIVILPGIHGTIQHANIICGYDPEEGRILTYVPQPETVGAIPESRFQQDWEQDDTISIVLLPQDMKHIVEKENPHFIESNRVCLEVERLRHQRKVAEALEKISGAVKLNYDNAQAWCIMGSILNEQNSQEAVSCYQKSIELNTNYYLAFRGLGNYYLKNKNFHNAEVYYSKAIEINPTRFGPIFKNRALVRLELGDKGGYRSDLLRYLEEVPNAADSVDIQEALNQL
jgi:tetratricopeptide repeat protein/peptidase C39-like protein